MRRYPFDALTAFLGPVSVKEAAIRLGVSARVVHRWKIDGLGPLSADRAACAIGLHPALVWPAWLLDADLISDDVVETAEGWWFDDEDETESHPAG